jgi:hypothetical protein
LVLTKRADALVPVPAVELVVPELRGLDSIEAANVDVHLVGVGTRSVEGVNAAMAAKVMLSGVRPKGVRRDGVGALQELEVALRHDEVKIPLLAADAAIALDSVARTNRDAIPYGTAVTASFENFRPELRHSPTG